MSEERLRLGLQKSGRLSEGSVDLLKKCGLKISRAKDNLYGRIRELPIDVMLLRDDDIPAFVESGACDIGIVGENVFTEHQLTAQSDAAPIVLTKLGFARCRLMLATPKEWSYKDVSDIKGKHIATSYPGLMKAYLDEKGIEASPIKMNGSVEVAPRLKIADIVCDIVSTGATLDANGLKPVETIFESEAILIRNALLDSPNKKLTLDALIKRIEGVTASREAKYVMMNAPKDAIASITELLPGADSPTILNLAGREDQVAIHAVCRETVFWSTLEELQELGASAILVMPIEKMLP